MEGAWIAAKPEVVNSSARMGIGACLLIASAAAATVGR